MRLRLFVGMWAILVLVVGATVVVADVLDIGEGDDQLVVGSDVTLPDGAGDEQTGETNGEPSEVLRAGQRRVEGTVTAAHLEGAVLEPRAVPVPLAITSERGFGNGGQVTGVTVNGEPSTLVWDGGRPFALTGAAGGALLVEPAVVDLVPEGFRIALGGGAHALVETSYRLDTPVAVGQAGIATPRDSVAFDAGPSALLEARGDAALVLGPQAARAFAGPGLVHLEGALVVTDATGTAEAPSLDAALAAFELTFTPDGSGGWRVTGLLDESTAS